MSDLHGDRNHVVALGAGGDSQRMVSWHSIYALGVVFQNQPSCGFRKDACLEDSEWVYGEKVSTHPIVRVQARCLFLRNHSDRD